MKKNSKRYWLSFSATSARRPLLWEMSHEFKLTFDIRSAKVTDGIGIMAVELVGDSRQIAAAVRWFGRHGVKVSPIELNILEG